MAGRHVAMATQRGRDAAGESWGRWKKTEEEDGSTKHLPDDEDGF